MGYSLPFQRFRFDHPWIWKILISFLVVSLIVFFMFSGVVGAFAFAAFLPAALSLSALGPALLVVAVVAAGVYVGTNSDQITQNINAGWNRATSYYNSLSATTKAKFDAVGANWNYEAVGDQTISLDTDMKTAVTGFLRETVTLSTANSFENLAPMVNGANYATGALLTEAYVNANWALSFTVAAGLPNAGTYKLVPTLTLWNSETLVVQGGSLQYKWASLQADGTYKVLDTIATQYGSTRYMNITGVGYGEWFSNVWTYGAGSSASIMGSVSSAVAQYKQIVAARLQLTSITAADWVDVTFPEWEWPQAKDEIKVPPGVITGSNTAPKVNVTTAQAEYIGDVVATPTNPNLPPDYTPPTTGGLNFAPLMFAGQLLTDKFPFSIPWDLKAQLNVFNVTPQAPVVNIDIPKFVSVGGVNMPLKFDVDLTQFNTLALITRWFLTLLIDIGFILMIRRLMPE